MPSSKKGRKKVKNKTAKSSADWQQQSQKGRRSGDNPKNYASQPRKPEKQYWRK